ncbi:MAG: hypothetical protein AABY41_03475 [Nitrospirota bacterium]|jgi:hypothetical protein
MIKRQKAFDCVGMKWEIQQEIAREFKGYSEKKMHDKQKERIVQNPVLGEFVSRIRVVKK